MLTELFHADPSSQFYSDSLHVIRLTHEFRFIIKNHHPPMVLFFFVYEKHIDHTLFSSH